MERRSCRARKREFYVLHRPLGATYADFGSIRLSRDCHRTPGSRRSGTYRQVSNALLRSFLVSTATIPTRIQRQRHCLPSYRYRNTSLSSSPIERSQSPVDRSKFFLSSMAGKTRNRQTATSMSRALRLWLMKQNPATTKRRLGKKKLGTRPTSCLVRNSKDSIQVVSIHFFSLLHESLQSSYFP